MSRESGIYYLEQEPGLCPTEFVVPDETMIDEATWVSDLTKQAMTMLPKSVEEVLALFASGRSILICDEEGKPIVHTAITFLYEGEKILEIGGLIVEPTKRQMGYATLATKAILFLAKDKFPGWKVMALCNHMSLPILLKEGGVVVDQEQAHLIPKAAWEACTTCPNYAKAKKEEKLCCDTLVIIP